MSNCKHHVHYHISGDKKKIIPMIAKIYILEMVPNYPQYLLLSKVKDNEVKEKC